MTHPMTAPCVLDREFLEMRAKVLQLAASFDRLERAGGSVDSDSRRRLLDEAIDIVRHGKEDRAEQVQLLFSREYDDGWQDSFGMEPRG